MVVLCGLLAALAANASAVPRDAAKQNTLTELNGVFAAGEPGRVRLTIKSFPDEPDRPMFGAKKVQATCEDGSALTRNFGSFDLRMRTARDFLNRSYTRMNGARSLFRVAGRINEDGTRATGTLLYSFAPDDPDDPECWTNGPLRWSAAVE
jgi:hypothetical protein